MLLVMYNVVVVVDRFHIFLYIKTSLYVQIFAMKHKR